MIVDLYKMDFKQINIKNKVDNYYDNLVKATQLETRNIRINEKKKLQGFHEFVLLYFIIKSRQEC